MTGIAEYFRELSEPDEFTVAHQLGLWASGRREQWRDRRRESRGPRKQVHHCCVCGEPGHKGRWRGEVICIYSAARAA